MPKNRVEDMIKIRTVKKEGPKSPESGRGKETLPPERQGGHETGRKSPRYLLWLVAFISVVFLFFSLSYVFSSADITITPRTEDVTVNESLTASRDSLSSSMPFDLVVISGEEEKKVEAEEKRAVKLPAKGVAIIYNDFSISSQLLSVDTRLSGSNGKIYKTEKRVVVPGRGKDGKPGRVEVGIYAASPGALYNSGPLDFKILGFKGTPKYEKIYGRSKGNITGGAEGDLYVIPLSSKAKITADLKNSLNQKLLSKATEQIPKGFILFKDAAFLTVNEEEAGSSSKESLIPIRLKGTLYGFLLEENKLTKKIAEDTIERYDDSDVYILNMKDLSFSLSNREDVPFSDMKTINFRLTGAAKIVWKFEADKFALELLNKKKKDFNLVLSGYPNVTSASLTQKPFWRMSLPNRLKQIKVIVNYPK